MAYCRPRPKDSWRLSIPSDCINAKATQAEGIRVLSVVKSGMDEKDETKHGGDSSDLSVGCSVVDLLRGS